jgi:hypothetical protein
LPAPGVKLTDTMMAGFDVIDFLRDCPPRLS